MTNRAAPPPRTAPTSSTARPGTRSPAQHPGPPLGAPAVLALLTFVAAAACGPLLGEGPLPSPFAASSEIEHYFRASRAATSAAAWLLLLSAIALTILSALVFSRLSFLAPNAPGPAIAGLGGVAAALTLAASAVPMWALSQPGVALDAAWPESSPQPGSANLVHALDYLSFTAGGPVHVAALGIMVLGVAMTCLFLRRTPTWLSWFGIALALVDLASSAAMLAEAATPLVPIGRFLSLLWLVWISLVIPRDRTARGR